MFCGLGRVALGLVVEFEFDCTLNVHARQTRAWVSKRRSGLSSLPTEVCSFFYAHSRDATMMRTCLRIRAMRETESGGMARAAAVPRTMEARSACLRSGMSFGLTRIGVSRPSTASYVSTSGYVSGERAGSPGDLIPLCSVPSRGALNHIIDVTSRDFSRIGLIVELVSRASSSIPNWRSG